MNQLPKQKLYWKYCECTVCVCTSTVVHHGSMKHNINLMKKISLYQSYDIKRQRTRSEEKHLFEILKLNEVNYCNKPATEQKKRKKQKKPL